MRTLRVFLAGLRALWRGDQTRRDIDEELRDFQQRQTDDFVEHGLSGAEAERKARSMIGSLSARGEEVRSAGWEWAVETIYRDATYAWRMLRRNPGFTAVAVLTLALGFGVNAAISSLYAGIAVRPLPIPEADRAFRLLRTSHSSTRTAFSYPRFLEYQNTPDRSSTLVATSEAVLVLSSAAGTERCRALLVSSEYFALAPAATRLGRPLAAVDHVPQGSSGVVVRESIWRRHFAGREGLVDQHVTLNGVSLPIVGVAGDDSPGLSFANPPDVWLPLNAHRLLNPGSNLLDDDSVEWLNIYARIPHPSAATPVSDMLTAVDRKQIHGESHATRITLIPAARRTAQQQEGLRNVSSTAAAAGMIVTLIACLNLAALLLARTVQRQREFALMDAIGASAARLTLQLLVESLLLASAAATIGLAGAYAAAPLVRELAGVPLWLNAAPDWEVAWRSFAVAGAAGLFVSIGPIFHTIRRTGTAGGLGVMSRAGIASPLRRWLVGAEVCGAVVLVVVALLLSRGVARANHMAFGFDVENVLDISLDLRAHGIAAADGVAIDQRIEERLRGIPGVDAVARTQYLPLDPSGTRSGFRDGSEHVTINHHRVSPEYFATIGIDLAWGRTFSDVEIAAASPVAVINEGLARRLGRPEDALGTSLGRIHRDLERLTVVGIARDALVSDPRDTKGAYVYRPLPLRDALETNFVLRTSGPADLWAARVEQAVGQEKPELRPLVTGVANRVREWVEPARAGAKGASIVALLAVLLSVIGVYGVSAYGVRQRLREIGIRLALGATPRRLVLEFATANMRPVIIGSCVGVLVSIAASRLVQGLLFGLDPLDAATFLGALCLFWLPGSIAVLVGVSGAGRVDPATTLRAE